MLNGSWKVVPADTRKYDSVKMCFNFRVIKQNCVSSPDDSRLWGSKCIQFNFEIN